MEVRGREIIPVHSKQTQAPEIIIPAVGAIMEIVEMAVAAAIHARAVAVTRALVERAEVSALAIVLTRIRLDAARPIVVEDVIQIAVTNALMDAPVAIQHVLVAVMRILHAMVVIALVVAARAVILQMEVQMAGKLDALTAVVNVR